MKNIFISLPHISVELKYCVKITLQKYHIKTNLETSFKELIMPLRYNFIFNLLAKNILQSNNSFFKKKDYSEKVSPSWL